MTKLEIRSEDDLFDAIARVKAMEGEEAPPELDFVGWPHFTLTIKGDDFEGGVPTRIMPAIMSLQKQINRTYSVIVHGEERRLKKSERDQTELVVRFEKGSTTFVSDLTQVLNTLAQHAASSMNGTHATITILGLASVLGGYAAWKSYLNNQLEKKQLDHRVEMSQQETERQRQITSLADQNDMLRTQMNEIQETQAQFLKKMDDEDEIVIDDTSLIDGRTAHKAVRRPPVQTVEDRLDGQFMILTVDSGVVDGGYRLKVRQAGTDREMTVDVPEGTLSPDQVTALQDGEWGKRPVDMKINVKKSHDRIKGATLIRAGLIGSG